MSQHPNIEPLIALSTGHLTQTTCDNIAHLGTPSYPNEYGGFVWVPTDTYEAPEDMRLCIEFARGLGCVWIKFDRDAAPIEELPYYEW